MPGAGGGAARGRAGDRRQSGRVVAGRARTGWDAYLATFHAERAGITEEVLGRAVDEPDGLTPYAWLIQGLDPAARVLDLGCGSGPARPPEARWWVGLDRSGDELARAVAAGRGPLVRGDAIRLPVPAASVDVVTAALSLMLVQPLDRALAEVARVLRPGGELRLLLPAQRPLSLGDVVRYLRLFLALRATTSFPPSDLRTSTTEVLAEAGLAVERDEARRFERPLAEAEDADRFVASWYLPGVPPQRVAAAQARARSLAPTNIGIPLRRVVARRA